MKGEMVRGQHSYSQTRAQRCIQEVADDHLILWQQIKKATETSQLKLTYQL